MDLPVSLGCILALDLG